MHSSSFFAPVSRASCAVLACASFSLASLAATADIATLAPGAVEHLVITATRIEQPLATIGAAMTVLQPSTVQASQKTALADLLATTPGVTLSRNGGLGAVTSLRIRGAESDQTTVLIDGVKMNDPSSAGGGFNFGNLLTNDVARIEVLRGPQSTLWGSQAIGGVINIVTPAPSGPLRAQLSAEGGSRNTRLTSAHVQAGGERFSWRVGGNALETDGVSAFDEDLGGREKDGYRNLGFNARGILQITDQTFAEVRSTWSQGRVEFDGYPAPAFAFSDTREYGYTEELASYAGLTSSSFGDRLTQRLGFAYTDTDRENFNPDAAVRRTFDASGSNKRWEYQGAFEITARSTAVFGLESERSELSTASPSAFNPRPAPLAKDVRLDSAYAQLQFAPIEAISMSAGARRDDHDVFGGNTTAQAALAWSVAPATVLRASYGEGFKAPTLYQLFSQYGNTSLAAENAYGWDAGVEQRLFDGAVALQAAYFQRDTRNMIDFASCFGNPSPRCVNRPFGFYENLQQTSADGVELGVSARIGERLQVAANYTGLDARNDVRGGANFRRLLARRPRDTFNAEATYSWNLGLAATFAVQRVGRSFDDAANTIVVDDYTLVDLRAAYDYSSTLQIHARIENLFDEDYATARQYGSLGRGAFAGFRYTF